MSEGKTLTYDLETSLTIHLIIIIIGQVAAAMTQPSEVAPATRVDEVPQQGTQTVPVLGIILTLFF